MYTWGYIKENTLNKLNLEGQEANELGFLSKFSYYANEAMTQICSVRPHEKFYEIAISEEANNLNTPITMPNDFVAFNDDVVHYRNDATGEICDDVGDDFLEYHGYNQVICYAEGTYVIPYSARWYFFTKDMADTTIIPAPADICDALPSYIASQCYKIDDEVKAATYRNEFEMFLARIDDTSFRRQRTLRIGGDW